MLDVFVAGAASLFTPLHNECLEDGEDFPDSWF